MAMSPLATVEDLSTWMGVPVTDGDRAAAIIAAASTLVRNYTGRTWVDAEGEPEVGVTELQLDSVHTVVILVAERVWSNPRGVTQQVAGPFSESVAAWAAYGLALTDDEKTMLPTPSGSGIPGLSSVRVQAPASAAGVPRSTWSCDDEDDEGS